MGTKFLSITRFSPFSTCFEAFGCTPSTSGHRACQCLLRCKELWNHCDRSGRGYLSFYDCYFNNGCHDIRHDTLVFDFYISSFPCTLSWFTSYPFLFVRERDHPFRFGMVLAPIFFCGFLPSPFISIGCAFYLSISLSNFSFCSFCELFVFFFPPHHF